MSNVKTDATRVKRVVTLLTAGQIGFLKEIQEQYQLPTLTGTIAYAISMAYRQMKMDNVKLYGYGAEAKRPTKAVSEPQEPWEEPVAKVKKPTKEEAEAIETAIAINEAINIAENVLKGVVIRDADGEPKSIKWFQYESFNRTQQEDPILDAEGLVVNQYLPSRDAVEATRKRFEEAGKALPYDVNETMADFLGMKSDGRKTKVVESQAQVVKATELANADWETPV